MQVTVRNIAGEVVEEIELQDHIFAIEPNKAVMHQALVRQLANARQGTHNTKTRSEVRGTTAKWYRQKGTGRARHGDRKAPIFVGGGVAHGPKPRSYKKDMPKKMRRLALRSALSAKVLSEQIIVLDDIQFDDPKTKNMIQALDNLDVKGSVVVLLAERNENVERSIRNLANVKYLRASYLNIRDLLGHDYVIIPKASVEIIDTILGQGRRP
ncbi:MAG: 50S ribosomal protein L4 [Aliifodinibius sp.]|nr:50S ribosomal protein L4 [Fodinibius sp.]NIW95437.1 50S ribosomal protein L4 [Phycisphaerae bacterium]NIY29819.1 50S ribosomal protein L4 [Fodinibius sp.]